VRQQEPCQAAAAKIDPETEYAEALAGQPEAARRITDSEWKARVLAQIAMVFATVQRTAKARQMTACASRLLAALADPSRGIEAVVVGEPQRAFYGNQFGNTFPLFARYGVPPWVPEVDGPIDPDNEAHDLIMSVFGGVSQRRTEPDQDPGPCRDGRAGPVRGPLPRRAAAVRLQADRRRAAPRPRRPPTGNGCTPWRPTSRPPRWSAGSSPATWPEWGSRPSPRC